MNILLSATVAALLSFIYYMIPSPLEPVLWTDPSPLLVFENKTNVNNVLSFARQIKGNFTGPESIAFSSNGLAYISFSDGTIGSFTADGSFIEVVFFVGGYILSSSNSGDGKYNSNGISSTTIPLYEWCKKEAATKKLAWNVSGETLCGRPLGLRYKEEVITIFLVLQ